MSLPLGVEIIFCLTRSHLAVAHNRPVMLLSTVDTPSFQLLSTLFAGAYRRPRSSLLS